MGAPTLVSYIRARPFQVSIAAIVAIGLLAGVLLAGRSAQGGKTAGRNAVVAKDHAKMRALPATPPPVIEPTIYAAMSPDAARLSNAAMPLAKGPVASARPFIFEGLPADRANALTCLTAAIVYEAGDDPPGERAVAQVVLNRLRHPVFPKAVCDVIFQGSDRQTGCQFTFTCDGALDRPPNPAAWARAKAIADAALSGFVFRPVGTATHYHTDWVVPYWRDTLDKIAIVHSQIFYRWPGPWGMPRAFTGVARPPERLDPRLVAYAGPPLASAPAGAIATTGEDVPLGDLQIDGVPASNLKGSIVRAKDEERAQYLLQLDPKAFPGSYAIVGFSICAEKPECLVLGWTSPSGMPRTLPVASSQGLAFRYAKTQNGAAPQMQWDCSRMPRAIPNQCLPGTSPH